MAKYYFHRVGDRCYTIEYYLNYMKENGIKEMNVFEAKVERGTGMFFCQEFWEFGEVGESCGKHCPKYQPRNGKSGICRHHSNVFEQTDKVLKLKL